MEKERRFKCLGDDYIAFRKGHIYGGDEMGGGTSNVELIANTFQQDWQEVFEETELTFPRMMFCGDTENESTWTPQRVIYIERELEIPFPFRTLDGNVPGWRFAKEMPQVKELTITEAEKMLSELKGEEIKIKEEVRL